MQNPNPFLDEHEEVFDLQQDSLWSEEKSSAWKPFLLKPLPSTNDWSEDPWEVLTTLPSQELSTSNAEENSIKREDLAAIDDLKMDAERLFKNLKKGIEEAVVQWPKWDIIDDWKARAALINAFMKATWRFKADNVINVMNLFWKVNTKNTWDIY